MALTGINANEITASIRAIISAHSDLKTACGTDFQSKFVDEMGKLWACKYAQEYFQEVKTAMDDLLLKFDNQVANIVDVLNSAASNWANANHGTWSKVTFNPIKKTISISAIRLNINGVEGIDKDNAKETATNRLSAIKTSVERSTTDLRKAVNSCGFIGAGQDTTLQATITSIKTSIDKVFGEIQTSLNAAIENTVKDYTDLAGKVKNAFEGSQQ